MHGYGEESRFPFRKRRSHKRICWLFHVYSSDTGGDDRASRWASNMRTIQEILEQEESPVMIEVDPNASGDGKTRVRFCGDSRSFRMVAEIFTVMADTVDNPGHPASDAGWHLMFNSEDLRQFQMKNATFLSLNCSPSTPHR